MRQLSAVRFAAAGLAIALAPWAWAQRDAGPPYDRAGEFTTTGVVISVIDRTSEPLEGIHVFLRSDAGHMEIYLGPKAFLDQNGFKIAKGDEIEICGSRVIVDGNKYTLIRTVKTGGKTFVLRDLDGYPRWIARKIG
jgi:hypothetical protein